MPKSESNLHVPEKCRCGKVHDMSGDVQELEDAIHHACYHDGGIIPWCGFGEIGMCAQCGMRFNVLGMGIPDGDFYPCPVCAFSCSRPCEEANICPCCGTQFGYSDAGPEPIEDIHARLRLKWLSKTPYPVFHNKANEPEHWNPYLQLAMGYRHGKTKVVRRVSREDMEKLFDSPEVQDKLKDCTVKSVEFPGPQEKPEK